MKKEIIDFNGMSIHLKWFIPCLVNGIHWIVIFTLFIVSKDFFWTWLDDVT